MYPGRPGAQAAGESHPLPRGLRAPNSGLRSQVIPAPTGLIGHRGQDTHATPCHHGLDGVVEKQLNGLYETVY